MKEQNISEYEKIKHCLVWIESCVITPTLKGFIIGTAHILTLTLLIKKFPNK